MSTKIEGKNGTPIVAPPPAAPPSAWMPRPRRWLTIVARVGGRAPTVTVDGWDAAFQTLASWRYRNRGLFRIEDQAGETIATAIVDDGGTVTMMVRV